MKKFTKSQHGFTLVELMITIVIIGILASVAVPLYTGYTKRAKASEADAALGTIRTAIRVYYAEHAAIPVGKGKIVTTIGIDVSTADLAGKYFNYANYKYTKKGTTTYIIQATGAGEAAGIKRQIDQTGNLKNF